MPLKALFLVSIISNTEINIIFKCTNLKVVYRITLIVLVIGKAQFRRAMLSCDSSCSSRTSIFAQVFFFKEIANVAQINAGKTRRRDKVRI